MKRKNLLIALAALLAVGLIAGPISAEEWSTGSEQQWSDELSCDDAGNGKQTDPGPEDCPGDEADETYAGWYWDNSVECNEGIIGAEGVIVDADGSESDMAAGAGVCNDGDTAPIKGRAVIGGSMDHGGFFVYADGTDGNESPADGWARADVTTDGPNAGCGADDGKRDATAGEAYDAGNCG